MRAKLKLFAVVLAFVMGLTVAAGVALGQDDSYWSKFKSVFVDWDDDAPAGSAKTTVSGVRGLEMQKDLGTGAYDWTAVTYMEDYKVSMDEEKSFLQAGQLGPFKAKGK